MLYISNILKNFPDTAEVFQSDTLFENEIYIKYNDFIYICSPNLYFIDNVNIILLSDIFYTCQYFLNNNKKMYFIPPKINNTTDLVVNNIDVFLLINENLGISDQYQESLLNVHNIQQKYNSIYTNNISSYITLFNNYKYACDYLYIKKHKIFNNFYLEFLEYSTLFNIKIEETDNDYIKIHTNDINEEAFNKINFFNYDNYIMSILTNTYKIYNTLTDFYNNEVLLK